ncbi:MAG: ribonuclease P protein subunit [Candidatus Micrarchaeia archaeon]
MEKNNTAPPEARRKQPDAHATEFVGKRVRVAKSSCKDLRGLSGVVLDESKNAFLVETPRGGKLIPKNCCVFDFDGILFNGAALLRRPEDAFKKVKKK